MAADDRVLCSTFFNGRFANQFQFSVRISAEAIDGYHNRYAEFLGSANMMQQVYHPFTE